MAFCGKHYVSCFLLFSCSGIALSFVKVECNKTTVGQFTQQSLLNCVVRPTQSMADIMIILVTWTKDGDKTPLLYYRKDGRFDQKPGYSFADPSWDNNNMNVSLLINDTKVTDEGRYSCEVVTDRGKHTVYTSLNVTAKYKTPNISRVQDKKDKALICRTSGGYPEGKLCWFDNSKTDWTSSSKLEVKPMDNGLLELSSTLTLKPGSIFSEYTCVVFNSSGGNESEMSIVTDPQTRVGDESKAQVSNIVAGVVVIGSLIVGLLLVLLICRRRSQQARRPSSTPLMGPHREIPTNEQDDVDENNPLDSIP